jgi:hypothetical protein
MDIELSKTPNRDRLIRTWHWSDHEFMLGSDYTLPGRRNMFEVTIQKSDERYRSFMCTINKAVEDITIDDLLDAVAKKAEMRARRGKTPGSAVLYAMSIRRQRRIESVANS